MSNKRKPKKASSSNRNRGALVNEAGPGSSSMTSPGLQGDWRDTCIACMRPADTALGLIGEAEWHIAVLGLWGIPEDQAVWLLCNHLGTPHDGRVPGGELVMAWRVCEKCAAKASPAMRPAIVPPGGVINGKIPCYHAPDDEQPEPAIVTV
ncbi:MAG TPA: hypothetical protein VMQ11_02415 [Alphaproteobacteria bacterium]|nr:hypothetical protein [Alphaproteobacteria bacterium]HUK70834.1 hypothetical protein [Streptosporangiaceae bacterium]